MSRIKRISLILVFTLIFSVIAAFHQSRIGNWIDTEVYDLIYASHSVITTSIFMGATWVGEVFSMICLSLCVVSYLLLRKMKIDALFFAIVMAVSSISNPIMKNTFDRERPSKLRLVEIGGYSFPSGHAMGSTSFFGSIIFIASRYLHGTPRVMMTAFCIFMIAMICLSRIYLGVHYPTDIMGGITAGLICILTVSVFFKGKLKPIRF
ncbi:phosphatase PAP2 family protein [Staphylococcus carnosus]|uniref:Phosphatidic acid phosphatase n=1 Tax=Staphylococcus carnosus TaxID=1281 RepID=A0AAJ0JRB2_STACA|nr:phosphatase PAP2 family protein [Staphylococcus carnosus]ANZ33376.1 phosphatidic acid phosphatase [Staphylococcus carnosus]KKB26290.1 phosphatidic acid phosphatase [Staphylococcus carnosus]KOR13668.1 phosphatidic acid phosphatase [Staphylococcus carnosus]POA03903.1 phosphatase PAP2 family protein [Staphylococcus carnosus]QQS85253.1 phosphatase PAP2 family protein [Staphylococcus carnosus]